MNAVIKVKSITRQRNGSGGRSFHHVALGFWGREGFLCKAPTCI